ncbi:MAG TPA: conjugal transfer protein TrbL family protein, partial [Candidatus Dormibacteraeota bacterium]|nr:conjugal transfer protein TrbL family protein [Candidatus Dormibacteraeota bacterium]
MSTALTTAPALLDALRDPGKAFVKMLADAVSTFVDGARQEIEHELDKYLFTTVDRTGDGTRAITDNPALRGLNLRLALASDVLVGAVVLYASLRSMWERSIRARYSLKVVLPRVLLAVVLAHFSLPLMQMAVDLDNALCRVAVEAGQPLQGSSLPWSGVISSDAVKHISATQDLFHAVFAVVLVGALVILVLTYVLRHALLGILIVMAPLAALCTTLNDTRTYARSWLRLFLVTVFMQAVQLIVLRVASEVAADGGGGLAQTLEGIATLFLMLKVPGALNTASHLETKAETIAKHAEKSLRKVVFPHHTTTRHSTS